jgi:DNA-binding NtrC family response regulator
MKARIPALIVNHGSQTLTALKAVLERQGMHVVVAESRAQAAHLLGGLNPAPLVFTDIELPDGTWADVLAAAERASQAVNVIVVARVVDTRFYVRAIETGAFDYIAPPFIAADLDYVVQTALSNVIGRRAAKSRVKSPTKDLFVGAANSGSASAHA